MNRNQIVSCLALTLFLIVNGVRGQEIVKISGC